MTNGTIESSRIKYKFGHGLEESIKRKPFYSTAAYYSNEYIHLIEKSAP